MNEVSSYYARQNKTLAELERMFPGERELWKFFCRMSLSDNEPVFFYFKSPETRTYFKTAMGPFLRFWEEGTVEKLDFSS